MIRWEEDGSANWTGWAGTVRIATVARAGAGRWDWTVESPGKAKGARTTGHRTTEIDARRAADASWVKWLDAAALRPDVGKLAESSLAETLRRADAADAANQNTPTGEGADELRRKLAAADARAERAEARAAEAETRATNAEAEAAAKLARLRDALGG